MRSSECEFVAVPPEPRAVSGLALATSPSRTVGRVGRTTSDFLDMKSHGDWAKLITRSEWEMG